MDPLFPHLRLSRPLAVINVETTSLSPSAACVVEVAALQLRSEDRPQMFRARVNPGEPIPAAATAVHGTADARPLADFLAGCDLAKLNLTHYDLPVLAHQFARTAIPFRLAGWRLAQLRDGSQVGGWHW